ncbi:ABC transporter ATP-binding protein [Pelagicoccus sp. NFK12]|uniref:ABC transporter ATP-binding protein n=1 Tax=Pelagicoccus enzymogenes TaxID=2773457 RepID=A0A927FA78_9BACT|nr:ABC transporter ATP-binding protein [Pelagicoccus enzymogenes]MBD5781343.1 ABC transporter ATP-binding protein [Pelagicoccus enzymogenes]
MKRIDPLKAPTLFGFLSAQQGPFAWFHFWRIFSILSVVPFPLITQYIVDHSIPRGDLVEMLLFCGYGGLLILIHYGGMFFALRILSERVQVVMVTLRSRIFRKLQFMHFGFLDKTQTGRLLSKYAFDTQNIEGAIIPILLNIIPEIIRSIALIGALVWINPWNALFVFTTVPIFALIRFRYTGRIERKNREVRLARERLTGKASEYISALKLVRGYGQEPQVQGELDGVSDAYSSTRVSQMLVNQGMNVAVFTMHSAINILAVCFGAYLVIVGKMSIGALIALVGALPTILNPINIFAQFSIQYLLAAESYNSIKELIDSDYVEQWRGQERPERLRGAIEFQNVSFAYKKDGAKVLDNIQLSIAPGENVAFVGGSGSGKSTLVNLLLGLYAPLEGHILIDGQEQADIDMRHLRRQCAIVMQDSILLSGTILDNIRFGRPEASEEEAIEAARQANAWEFISQLPEGLQTRVGERGASLSGGQRQRIAIARAILRDPAILVLDEATSALDNESERLVQKALETLAHGRTTITIAHRLSTIRSADRIVVVESGRIAESGSYDELAAKEGSKFQTLLAAQNGV